MDGCVVILFNIAVDNEDEPNMNNRNITYNHPVTISFSSLLLPVLYVRFILIPGTMTNDEWDGSVGRFV